MSDKSKGPDRRDFLKRVGAAAVFAPPLMVALGGTASAASAYDKINANIQQATKLTSQTRRMGRELTEEQFKALGRPIRALKQQADSLYEWHSNGWPPRP